MSVGEIVSLVVAIVSVLASACVSIFTVRYFNNKRDIYEIKKKAILRSLCLLDDYMSATEWKNKEVKPVQRKNLTYEYLTIEARECYSELVLTCKDTNIIKVFSSIVFDNMQNESGTIDAKQLQEYRLLCRKELGLKVIDIEEETSFINAFGLHLKTKDEDSD